MTKLMAIWRLIWSEHFVLVTGGGSVTAIVPKSTAKFTLMTRIAEKLSELDNPTTSKETKERG